MNLSFSLKTLMVSTIVSASATANILAKGTSINDDTPVDITSKYISNPSFESDKASSLAPVNNSADGLRGYTLSSPTGWTVTGTDVTRLLVTRDCYTDNNFGKVSSITDGTQAYYLRMGWSTGTTSLAQTISSLPVGKYMLTVSQRTGYANSASSTLNLKGGSASTSIAFDAGSNSIFTSKAWTTSEVIFDVTKAGSVTIGIDIAWQSGGSCIMVDNFKLYQLSDDYKEPQDPTEESVSSYTEGVITNDFVSESAMMGDLLQMLADFSKYMVNDWNQCAEPNSINESCGFFKGENSGGSNEQGVRPNADLSMICAFLVKYGKPAGVKLPTGVTWSKIEEMARKSLIFAYSTHKANKLKVCSGGAYWGSTSTSDFAWESSLWAMSVAYSAYFQWDSLSEAQRKYIYNLLKAECNYELGRSIPTGYNGDTKAEENGWEADILAATLGLFPDDPLASKWFDRLRAFAINSYSHTDDASDKAPIDPEYDNKSVADYYKGQNLYNDYSLQNHNLFHTSYQNVVMQELGEAALALKMFQNGIYGKETWKTNALMHNNQQVQDSILNWLALADGELAMPNGNDWSLFLYDQITSYTTQACFQRDANALMLENLAYKYIKARQKTTSDGSWLLRADVGARRMGVEAHRVMMTYLMHDVLSTADLTPTKWDDFNKKYSEARLIPCQNIVRAATDDRFTCFSWSNGLKSYTGYIASNSVDKNKIIVPYRANNTGNILGWYEVSGKSTDASPVTSGIYKLDGNAYTMNGEINTNGASLNNRFAIYSTPGNAFIYLDYVTGKASGTITAEKGGLMAISTDELMKVQRTIYYADTHKQLDGSKLTIMESQWANIDNELGIVGHNGKKMAFGDRGANNSIYTSKFYPAYSNTSRTFKSGDIVDRRNLVWYSRVNAETTKELDSQLQVFTDKVPQGWNAVIAADPDKSNYLLIANFQSSSNEAILSDIRCQLGAPVFAESTTIKSGKSSATFKAMQNNSIGEALLVYVDEGDVTAVQDSKDAGVAYLLNTTDAQQTVKVNIISNGQVIAGTAKIAAGKGVKVSVIDGVFQSEETEIKPLKDNDYTSWIVNPAFDGNSSYGWTGAPTVNYNCAEKFSTATFDIYQIITGLPAGKYILSCNGFYRDGAYSTAAQHRTNGTEKLNAYLYANDEKVALVSILDEAGKKGAIGVKPTSYGYIPDNMEQANIYFADNLYFNSLECTVGEDGILRIGVKKSANNANDWTIFDNFKLTYVDEDEPTAITHIQTSLHSSDNNIYTISGHKVDASQKLSKGVYIVGGKKVYVK